jgi:hypothetical protein
MSGCRPPGEGVCREEITEGDNPERETPPSPLFCLLWRQTDERRWVVPSR